MAYDGLVQAKAECYRNTEGGRAPLPGEIREGLIDEVTTQVGHKGRS